MKGDSEEARAAGGGQKAGSGKKWIVDEVYDDDGDEEVETRTTTSCTICKCWTRGNELMIMTWYLAIVWLLSLIFRKKYLADSLQLDLPERRFTGEEKFMVADGKIRKMIGEQPFLLAHICR